MKSYGADTGGTPVLRWAVWAVLGSASSLWGAAVADKVRDKFAITPFEKVHFTSGLFADRLKVNLEQRLLKVDEKGITDGFVHRPGSHPWIGEHAGKFLHAAANTYAYSRDPRLKELMDRVANTLITSQMPDGYLGTYTEDKRWTSWDVWSHKYDLIGLLAWYDVTHDEKALACCTRIGDLMINTFGDDKKDISLAGEHMGMAATSILEPMCYLYRHTGEQKYLDFCLYVTRSIEKNSKVISSLSSGKDLQETANAKAYEMLSNLVGLVELYRLTGDETFLKPAVNGWNDAVKNDHLYITGTLSTHEHFRPPGELPAAPADDVGEGCVTVTWMQLNFSLLRLTGDVKYADQLEKSIYNHLLAAQNPTSGDVCYYTSLLGPKPYVHTINCCLSSVPRGLSMIPMSAYGVMDGAIVVNQYAASEASFDVKGADGKPVSVKLTCETDFPRNGRLKYTFAPSRPVAFNVRFRHQSWSDDAPNTYEEAKIDPAQNPSVSLEIPIPFKRVPGGHSYPTSFAIVRGPQVLALDAGANPGLPIPTMATVTNPKPTGTSEKDGTQVYAFAGVCSTPDEKTRQLAVVERPIKLIPFADAASPIVWLPTPDRLARGPLPVTYGGTESLNRAVKKDQGSVTDLLSETFKSTANRRKVDNDWIAVELPKPATIKRVVFTQGPIEADGGWWDVSAGKPKIQVKKSADQAEWTTVATLDSYPATTTTDAKGVQAGQAFEVTLPSSVEASSLRIIGHPSSGNNPNWTHVTCAELAAYADGGEGK